MGPESTVEYYRLFMKAYQDEIDDGNYPELLINSINMRKMLEMVSNKEWERLILFLSEAIKALANAGADYVLIASNTPHIVFDELLALSPIPILSIVEETCRKAKALGLKKIGLFGTRVTMQTDFYAKVFEREGISVFVPNEDEQDYIHTKIFSELQSLVLKEETKTGLLLIVKRMIDEEGIEGLVLGCTELPLILTQDEYGIKFLNTSKIHVESAIRERKKFCVNGQYYQTKEMTVYAERKRHTGKGTCQRL